MVQDELRVHLGHVGGGSGLARDVHPGYLFYLAAVLLVLDEGVEGVTGGDCPAVAIDDDERVERRGNGSVL